MAISKITAGTTALDPAASTGAQVATAVNKLIDATTGVETVEAITLKGLPQTVGAPAGHGDVALAINAASVNSVKSLPQSPVANQRYSVTGYYANSTVGGGDFVYDASRSKADHNGGTVIAPEAIAAWDGTVSNLSQILSWTGTGSGCYVRLMPAYTLEDEYNVDIFGAVPVSDVDNYLSFRAAINVAQLSVLPSSVVFEGYYVIKTPLGSITRPISIRGAGRRNSIIYFNSTSANAVFLNVDDVGFSNETTEQPMTGDVAYPVISNIRSGFGMFDMQVTGNRSRSQHAICFRGNCDNVTMENVDISYFNGRGLWLGLPLNDARGNVRESYFSNVVIRNCGRADSTSSLRIEKTESAANPSADATNLCVFNGLQIIFSYGRAIDVVAVRGASNSTPIYGVHFTDIILHGRGVDSLNNGPQIQIEGHIVDIKMQGTIAKSFTSTPAVVVTNNSGTKPAGIDLDLSLNNCVYGVQLVDHGSLKLKIRNAYTTQQLLNYVGTNTGTVNLEIESDNHLLKIPASVTLNGTNPVEIPISGVTGVDTFMQPPTEDRSVSCQLGSHVGVATYVLADNKYYFTPTTSSTATILAEDAFLTKVIIPTNRRNVVNGQWDGFSRLRRRVLNVGLENAELGREKFMYFLNGESTSEKYAYARTQSDGTTAFGVTDNTNTRINIFSMFAGIASPVLTVLRSFVFGSAWDSNAKLRLGNFRLWVDSAGRLRIKSSEPTSDTDGTVVGTQT